MSSTKPTRAISRRAFLAVMALGVGKVVVSDITDKHTIYLPILQSSTVSTPPADCLSSQEVELAQLVNDYRNQNNLPSVPISKSLMEVAHDHVKDLYDNAPNTGTDSRGLPCNLHSWSDKGNWTPVCYTDDHQYASGMWDKPREITFGVYQGNGYENAYEVSANFMATAEDAFNAWKNDPAHNQIMIEQGPWEGCHWPVMGVGIYQNYAVLWFGDQPDPQGTVGPC